MEAAGWGRFCGGIVTVYAEGWLAKIKGWLAMLERWLANRGMVGLVREMVG